MESNKPANGHSKTSPTTANSTENKAHSTDSATRLGKLKVAFLYVLIAGLGLAAITSVIALLVGEFNAVIGKTLLTIFILFSHSLLLLAILWADIRNELGKSVISTTIFTTTFANLITSTLGTWEVISGTAVLNWMGVYFLLIGGSFIIAALLKLRLNQQAIQVAITTAIGFVGVTIITLIPWVLKVVPQFDPLYFRIIAALSILSSASFLIALILRRIAQSKIPASEAKPKHSTLPNGMLAIYIVVGIITAAVWNIGLISLIDSGTYATSSQTTQYL